MGGAEYFQPFIHLEFWPVMKYSFVHYLKLSLLYVYTWQHLCGESDQAFLVFCHFSASVHYSKCKMKMGKAWDHSQNLSGNETMLEITYYKWNVYFLSCDCWCNFMEQEVMNDGVYCVLCHPRQWNILLWAVMMISWGNPWRYSPRYKY